MNERRDIEIKKAKNQFRKDARIKECFHFDSANCSNEIISAHSIQRGNVLEILEHEVDGNKAIYSFLHLKHDIDGKPIGFEPLGKKIASTFFGFCGYHDNLTFKPIENQLVDINNDEHCFLLSYRAFAKDHHAKYESVQGYKQNEFYQKDARPEATEGLIGGSELGVRDGKIVKNRLNEMLRDKKFSELEYLTYELEYTVPIALAASLTPEFTIKNQLLNLSANPEIFYEYVNFVIHPLKDKTLILLSCLPEHSKSIKFIDQLNELKQIPFLKAISSLAISHVENTFISPLIWERLSLKEREILIYEILMTMPPIRSLTGKFFHSRINFLDSRFAINVA